jgi:hypothetical protein
MKKLDNIALSEIHNSSITIQTYWNDWNSGQKFKYLFLKIINDHKENSNQDINEASKS